ncbi:MAG: rhodanese-like domain-containing protein [Tunicatimonas sp.]
MTCLVSVNLACQSTPDKPHSDSEEVTTETSADKVGASAAQPLINQRLSSTDFATKLEALPNEQLIDVRTPDEYQTGHLPHSTVIDFKGEDFRDKMAQLDKKQPVMVYCAAGGRSTAAAALLEELGFSEVYELEGGITRWREAGQVIEK